jgi:hypothetical protein
MVFRFRGDLDLDDNKIGQINVYSGLSPASVMLIQTNKN